MMPNELTHHGIKGQRWGVRRYQNPDGTYTFAGKKRYSKNPKKMSDQELDTKLNRLRKESEYRRLKENENTGRKFVSNYKKVAAVTSSAALAAWSVKKGKEVINKYKDIIFKQPYKINFN